MTCTPLHYYNLSAPSSLQIYRADTSLPTSALHKVAQSRVSTSRISFLWSIVPADNSIIYHWQFVNTTWAQQTVNPVLVLCLYLRYLAALRPMLGFTSMPTACQQWHCGTRLSTKTFGPETKDTFWTRLLWMLVGHTPPHIPWAQYKDPSQPHPLPDNTAHWPILVPSLLSVGAEISAETKFYGQNWYLSPSCDKTQISWGDQDQDHRFISHFCQLIDWNWK